MSLPITAVGPEKVETKPILIDFCALAVPAESASRAVPKSRALRMVEILPSGSAVSLFLMHYSACKRQGASRRPAMQLIWNEPGRQHSARPLAPAPCVDLWFSSGIFE